MASAHPALKRKDAGRGRAFPNGMKVKCTNWPGYGSEYVEELELLASSLKRSAWSSRSSTRSTAAYIRGSFSRQVRRGELGTLSPFSEVDGYLYNFFSVGLPNNRSHVADTDLE